MATERSTAEAEDMFQGEKATNNFHTEFDGKLNDLKGQAQTLRENWTSRMSAAKFDETMARWTRDALVMGGALDDLARLLNRVGHTYLTGAQRQSQIMGEGEAPASSTPTYNISGQ